MTSITAYEASHFLWAPPTVFNFKKFMDSLVELDYGPDGPALRDRDRTPGLQRVAEHWRALRTPRGKKKGGRVRRHQAHAPTKATPGPTSAGATPGLRAEPPVILAGDCRQQAWAENGLTGGDPDVDGCGQSKEDRGGRPKRPRLE